MLTTYHERIKADDVAEMMENLMRVRAVEGGTKRGALTMSWEVDLLLYLEFREKVNKSKDTYTQ